MAELCEKQQLALQDPSQENFLAETEASVRWERVATLEEAFLKQKAKIHWLRVGDQNNKYFHQMLQAQNSKNAIRTIQLTNGQRVSDPKEIKSEAERYFRDFLQQNPSSYTGATSEDIQLLVGYSCNPETQRLLAREVSAEEIRSVLFNMPANKAPGLDGYTTEFFKAAWSIIGPDFIVAVQSFS